MKKYIIFALLIILVVSAAVFGKSLRKNESLKIEDKKDSIVRVVFFDQIEDVALLYLFAKDKGFFEKNNLKVQDVFSQKDLMAPLLAGEADIVLGTEVAPLIAYLNGAETRVIANTFTPFTYYGLSRFDKDHFGSIKNVAVNALAGDPPLTMQNALRNMGVDVENVSMIVIPTEQAREAALESGQIDFTIVASEKYLLEKQLDKKYEVVGPDTINSGSSLLRGVSATKKSISENTQGIEKFVKSYYQALEYMKNNRKETEEYIMKLDGFDQQRASAYYDRFLKATNSVSFVPEMESITKISEETKKGLKIDSNREINGLIDSSFANLAK